MTLIFFRTHSTLNLSTSLSYNQPTYNMFKVYSVLALFATMATMAVCLHFVALRHANGLSARRLLVEPSSFAPTTTFQVTASI